MQDIFALIYRSNIVVCDFTGKNPNLFYEAGIAHVLGKHVVPITQQPDDVPFDLRHHRYSTYLANGEGLEVLTGTLAERFATLTGRPPARPWSVYRRGTCTSSSVRNDSHSHIYDHDDRRVSRVPPGAPPWVSPIRSVTTRASAPPASGPSCQVTPRHPIDEVRDRLGEIGIARCQPFRACADPIRYAPRPCFRACALSRP